MSAAHPLDCIAQARLIRDTDYEFKQRVVVESFIVQLSTWIPVHKRGSPARSGSSRHGSVPLGLRGSPGLRHRGELDVRQDGRGHPGRAERGLFFFWFLLVVPLKNASSVFEKVLPAGFTN